MYFFNIKYYYLFIMIFFIIIYIFLRRSIILINFNLFRIYLYL